MVCQFKSRSSYGRDMRFIAMSAKSEMMKAHEAMATVLDAKFANVPEWQAFRSIDRALLALETEQVASAPPQNAQNKPTLRILTMPSYTALTARVLDETGLPITTPKLVNFISQHRKLGDDPEKAKINITSSLSKTDRFKSIPWEGGRAWWYADRPVPKKETAGG
jgi:hypothetical protein